MAAVVPPKLHFIWIGKRLPWFAQAAVLSALKACPNATATLWASDDLRACPCTQALLQHPRFRLAELSEASLLAGAPSDMPSKLVSNLFRTLTQPAARANVARLAILLREGGIYLDTDTVTLRDLGNLSELGAYCGLEHVVWPLALRYGIGFAVARGWISSELGSQITSDPDVLMLMDGAAFLAGVFAVEGWYALAKRLGWAT